MLEAGGEVEEENHGTIRADVRLGEQVVADGVRVTQPCTPGGAPDGLTVHGDEAGANVHRELATSRAIQSIGGAYVPGGLRRARRMEGTRS